MDKINKQEIKHKIETEIVKTQKAIIEYTEMSQPIAPENAIGRISRMDAINNKSISEAALHKSKEKYDKLKYMLSKIDDSDFGICIKCKHPIPIGRLLLVPQSNLCVHCSR
jgi:DnaK suppressor protein